mgnify:CR=1 FL=1
MISRNGGIMENKAKTGRKLIMMSAELFAPVLIVMIVVFILLNNNIIGVLPAFILMLIVFGIVLLLIISIIRSVVIPIRAAITGISADDKANEKVNKKLQKLSSRNDETGELVRNIQNTFGGITNTITAIRIATTELEQVSEEFVKMFSQMQEVVNNTNSAVDTITDNTTVQVDKVEDIKVKTDSISRAVDNIHKNIEGLKESIDTLNECNNRAADIMKELITISEESGHAMDEVSNETERTNASAQEIRKVTEIIAGISNQTNLLALNASIEAARAGENGKGFAVVAEQIRELADQSRESTEHINQIVNGLIENSNISVETAKKVSEAFEKQDAKIKDTEAIFATLNSEINRVGNAVSGIAAEASDLEQHKNTIAYGVDNLAQFAEENASSGQITKENMNNLEQVMEQCKGSTDKIANVSAELVTQIKKFSGNGLKKR